MITAVLTHKATNKDCVTTADAAEQSGLSTVYLASLLRKKTLKGFRLSHDWFIYVDSLEEFLATPRKSGPKGPINRGKRENTLVKGRKTNEKNTVQS